MVLFYFNKNKGIFIISLGAILLLAYFIIVQVLLALSNDNPLITFIFEHTKILFFNRRFLLTEIFYIFLLIYAFKIIDGFIDGVVMTLIDLEVLQLLKSIFLKDARLIIEVTATPALITVSLDLNLMINILIIGYIWVLIWEIVLINTKIQLFARIKEKTLLWYYRKMKKMPEREMQAVRKEFQDEREFNAELIRIDKIKDTEKEWVDNEKDDIILSKDETYFISEWTKLKSEFKKTWFSLYILDPLALIFFGAIYGILVYLDNNVGGPLYNETVNAFFFPIWIIILFAYKNPATYLRALIYVWVSIAIQNYLWDIGYIDSGGYIISSFIIGFVKIVGIDLTPLYNNMPLEEFRFWMYLILSIIMIVEFIIMLILSAIQAVRKGDFLEYKISNKAIYVRQKKTFNTYDLLSNFLFIIMFPFNLFTYVTIFNQIRYKRQSMKESWTYDYGKLDFQSSILKLKRRKNIEYEKIFGIIVLFFFGFALMFDILGIPILFLASYKLYQLLHLKNTVSVNFLKNKAKGALFILSTETRLKLFDVPEKYLPYFPEIRTLQ